MTRHGVIVVGAGVSGLTTAVTLAMAGCDVAIHAAEAPVQTTSALAAAIWHPFYQAPDLVYLDNARQTYEAMARLSEDNESGVVMRTLTEYFARDAGTPWWAECVPEVARLASDVPSHYACAYRMDVPVADATTYLGYLMHMFLDLGGQFVLARIEDPATLLGQADYVVNCCGYGSAAFGDGAMSLSRAVVLRAERHDAVSGCYVDDSDALRPTYVVKRMHDVILGGTADPEMTSTVIGERQVGDIVRRCARLCEGVMSLDIVDARVGFRPMRRTARVERDLTHAGLLHNYGHGGGGFTLSWGCANQVLRLMDEPAPN